MQIITPVIESPTLRLKLLPHVSWLWICQSYEDVDIVHEHVPRCHRESGRVSAEFNISFLIGSHSRLRDRLSFPITFKDHLKHPIRLPPLTNHSLRSDRYMQCFQRDSSRVPTGELEITLGLR